MPYMGTHLGIKKLSFFVLLFEIVMPETINFTEKFQSVILLIYFKDPYAITKIGLHFKINNIISHFLFKKLGTLRFVKPVLDIYSCKTLND